MSSLQEPQPYPKCSLLALDDDAMCKLKVLDDVASLRRRRLLHHSHRQVHLMMMIVMMLTRMMTHDVQCRTQSRTAVARVHASSGLFRDEDDAHYIYIIYIYINLLTPRSTELTSHICQS